MARVDIGDDKPSFDLTGLFDIATSRALQLINVALEQLVSRTAKRLDVAESRVRLDFGRCGDAHMWTAKLVDEVKRDKVGEPSNDPMQAVGSLVEEVECHD